MDEDVKPWTIKGIAPEDRNAAIAAAGRQKVSIGVWIARAIRTQIQVDLSQERGLTVVSDKSPPPDISPPNGRITIQLDALVDVALKASTPELINTPLGRLIGTAIRRELRLLRPTRKQADERRVQHDRHPNSDGGGSESEVQGDPRRPPRGDG